MIHIKNQRNHLKRRTVAFDRPEPTEIQINKKLAAQS